jgi:carbon monoxide dehydrogenase subunit G
MVWVTARARETIRVNAPVAKVFALLVDVPCSGKMFPGIERIEDQGSGRYLWILVERRTLGKSFFGRYTTQHENNGKDEVRWRTIDGNVKTSGTWTLRGSDGAVDVTVDVESTVDAPVPSILKRPAELFAIHETTSGVSKQLAGIKAAVEARGPTAG